MCKHDALLRLYETVQEFDGSRSKGPAVFIALICTHVFFICVVIIEAEDHHVV